MPLDPMATLICTRPLFQAGRCHVGDSVESGCILGCSLRFSLRLCLAFRSRFSRFPLVTSPFQLKRGYNQWAASPVGFNPERHMQLDPTFSHFSLLWETKPSYPKQLQIEPLAPCPAPNGAWLYLEMEPGSIGHLLHKPPEGYEGDRD